MDPSSNPDQSTPSQEPVKKGQIDCSILEFLCEEEKTEKVPAAPETPSNASQAANHEPAIDAIDVCLLTKIQTYSHTHIFEDTTPVTDKKCARTDTLYSANSKIPIASISAHFGGIDAVSSNSDPSSNVKSTPELADLSPLQIAEARRIAGELVKLYRAGLISDADDPHARIYAGALRIFKAAVAEMDGKEVPPP